MTKFLIFPANSGNGNIDYHIQKIENPKPHKIRQSVGVYDSYEQAASAKVGLRTPKRFNKPR